MHGTLLQSARARHGVAEAVPRTRGRVALGKKSENAVCGGSDGRQLEQLGGRVTQLAGTVGRQLHGELGQRRYRWTQNNALRLQRTADEDGEIAVMGSEEQTQGVLGDRGLGGGGIPGRERTEGKDRGKGGKGGKDGKRTTASRPENVAAGRDERRADAKSDSKAGLLRVFAENEAGRAEWVPAGRGAEILRRCLRGGGTGAESPCFSEKATPEKSGSG